ncbi:hypothetical protein ACU6U9_04070 [Pseudomonas sp. HK3]|jgi:hypothetical protein
MEVKTTKGARAWLELATSAQLPILKVSAQLLTKQIKSGASLADMAHTIERDPALCLHLFLAANRKSANSDTAILNLNHVMTMLGMQGVIHYIKQAPKMTLHKSDAQQKGYLQAQAVSTLAGTLVDHWAQQTHSGSGEKLKWATILAGAPTWYMWHVGYGKMSEWQYRVQHDFEGSANVEKSIFGCLLEDVYRMIGRQIQLPELSQQMLERAQWPSLRQWSQMLSDQHMRFSDDDHVLRHLKSKPTTIMLLLNHLAQQVQRGWMCHRVLRSERVLSHLSGVDLGHVTAQNHQLAIKMSRQLMVEQVLPPAVSLLWPQQKINQPIWVRPAYTCWFDVPKSDPHASKNMQAQRGGERVLKLKEIPPRAVKRDVIVDVLQHLNKKISDFDDIHNIFLSCNKALHKGIGMRRGFICILNKTADCLRPVYCFGVESSDPIRSLKINLKENRLFGKLVVKSASFRVDGENVEQATNMLAADATKTLNSKNFMIMSLFSGDRPVGVVYADVSSAEQPISDQEYQAFKKVCQSTSHALERYKLSR